VLNHGGYGGYQGYICHTLTVLRESDRERVCESERESGAALGDAAAADGNGWLLELTTLLRSVEKVTEQQRWKPCGGGAALDEVTNYMKMKILTCSYGRDNLE